VVVLDVMMPGMDGLEVLRRLRATSDVFVILLTAKAEEVDKLVGLSVGADDYLTKPFSPRELVARVRAVLRRQRDAATPNRDTMSFAGLVIDRARREVLRDGAPVELTALEFDLLAALAASPGRVYSRRQLLEHVWGWDYVGDERVVDVHVRNLRRALGDDASAPSIVATVRGVGYKFVAAAA
jgi:DNA-binding response OmpR family regulator